MSGGVDSSVAAHLLLGAGHEVIGVFMGHGEDASIVCDGGEDSDLDTAAADLPEKSEKRRGCCSGWDARDAWRSAELLGISFYSLDVSRQFGRIIDYFVAEYTAGRTPNPCIKCNNWLKFGKLFEFADEMQADFVATGHHARIAPAADGPALLRAVDSEKDQSYVLAGIRRDVLGRLLFPVGVYHKGEIRARAARLGLPTADKRDSQEICFVPDGKHGDFVRARRGDLDTAGEIVTTDDRVVGTHPGIEQFTIGQRKGLRVALGEPRYIVRIEADTRRVVIGTREELARNELTAGDVNWLVDEPPGPFRCEAKIRYNSPAVPAVAEPLAGGRLKVAFDRPCYGVAPGQAVVCYDGPRVLGGGWIE